MAAPRSIDDYIATMPAEVQPVLASIRATVREAAPLAEERISYGMPAFFQDRALVYFGAFKKHIGFYPPVQDESLKAKLAKYAGPKGNLQFPLGQPVPHALITEIVRSRLKETRKPRPAEDKP
jgi:uncharacterized protein YdhG (YjbR/CyaY superfamily)